MTPLEAKRTTPVDFNYMVEALKLKEVDRSYWVHMQAWASQQIKATKKNGKPRFKDFSSFFDYEEAIDKVMYGKKHSSNKEDIADGNHRLNQYWARKKAQEETPQEGG